MNNKISKETNQIKYKVKDRKGLKSVDKFKS